MILFSNQAKAQVITYTNFSNVSALTLNGSSTVATTTDGNILRLVTAPNTNQAGSVFTNTQINASTFSTAFQFRLTSPGGITDGFQTGADGITFILQNNAATSVGVAGGGMGYQGINNSVAIEFDTFLNSPFSDPNTNHVGIDTNGSMISLNTANVATRFDNGTLWTAWIDYNGTTLEVRASDNGIRPSTTLLTQSISISTLLGGNLAYAGFTGGSGGAYANHDILAWTFSPSYIAGGVTVVPEPATLSLVALGLLTLGIRRRIKHGRSANHP